MENKKHQFPWIAVERTLEIVHLPDQPIFVLPRVWHIKDVDGKFVAEFFDEPTARLIAAAPSLLEFARDVQDVIACFCKDTSEPCFKCRARALLRKIEGE